MTMFVRTFINIIAFLMAITVFVAFIAFSINFLSDNPKNNHFINTYGDKNSPNKIAILKINGPILNEPISDLDIFLFNEFEIIYASYIEQLLKELDNEEIVGLIVSINSPGGSVSGSYRLFNQLLNFKKKNKIKIYFHTNDLLASGAYWASLSGNKIFASYGSIIGSIGVKGPDWLYYDNPISISSGILGNSVETKNGIKKFENIAGDSKDLFNPFRPPNEKEIQQLQKNVQNTYEDFINSVSKIRKIEKEIIINDLGAMIFDTKSAKNKYLIDDILPLEKVINFMIKELDIINYQIIENKNLNTNLLDKFLTSKLFIDNFNYMKDTRNSKICQLSKYGLSAILILENKYTSC